MGVVPSKTARRNPKILRLRQEPRKMQPVAQTDPRLALHRQGCAQPRSHPAKQTSQGPLPMGRRSHDRRLQTSLKKSNRGSHSRPAQSFAISIRADKSKPSTQVLAGTEGCSQSTQTLFI